VASWAQELGFDSLWASDHVVMPAAVRSRYPYAEDKRWDFPLDSSWYDPLLALAWAAAAAPDVKLGTSVVVLPLRHPLALAKQVASLDRLSGGRVLLGVGVGWMAEEFELLGVPFADRGSRSEEAVTVMRHAWRGSALAFDGDHWQLPAANLFPTPASDVPILWGGAGRATLERIARCGDGWHPLGLRLDELRDGLQRLRRLWARAGRDPASLIVVVRPGGRAPMTAATIEELGALGATHVIADPRRSDPELRDCHEDMVRLAETLGLRRRDSAEHADANAW
jgi:probable F420-dependent oxidoreductase